jgi:CHAD domain-containing protein
MRTTAIPDPNTQPNAGLRLRPRPAGPDGSAILHKIARDSAIATRANRRHAIGGDAEAVHAMRIALTRLRAAALFFHPWISNGTWRLLNREIDWLNSVLGKARNLDVTVEYSARKRYRHWAGSSRHGLSRSQHKAHRELAEQLRSARYSRLISEFDRWSGQRLSPGDGQAAPLNHVNDFCERRLRIWRDELSRQGRHVRALGRRQQHRFRIRCKSYRYVVESLIDQNVPLSREDFAFCDVARHAHQALGDLRDLRRLRKSIGRRPPHYRTYRSKLKHQVERLFRRKHL